MPLKDLLKRKDKLQEVPEPSQPATSETSPSKLPQAAEFTFMRSDTNTQSIINPPQYDGDDTDSMAEPEKQADPATPKKRFGRLRGISQSSAGGESPPQKEHKRLSQRLHIGHRKSDSASSNNVPSDLPEVSDAYSSRGDEQEKEAQWEQRATALASHSPNRRGSLTASRGESRSVSRPRSVSDAAGDVNIQEAIRLHEAGELETSTKMFHTLADNGLVLAQVLYGLSLRHGWGCEPNLELAVRYLQSAASNSATIEAEALQAGMKKGGAAKGELVLAIFELGNCFRYGWGISIDKAAARQYYETAANLGDTDAMNEAAWCYLEGFGGKKDKFKAAQLLRLAEKNGSKTLGNTWIWKDKYDPK